ncbi:MAG TPA: hypothetical protein VJ846_06840 [Sphingomicrobium sp.]|nr:hypothetical protein [Sphingomicrobium sp.]
MKIIQLAVALNNEGEESLYALTDDGQVLQRRWAANPRKRHIIDEPITYIDGWTEGWIPVENVSSVSVKHPEDMREAQ